MPKKIPLHIISGFLGSGKTTFLKKILEKSSRQIKTGIIQNEFAPVNIDGYELKNSGYSFDLLEINNGSVFCVCLLGDFIRSLTAFIEDKQPDILFIEASGLSDITSVSELFAKPPLSERIYFASDWCIVDALNFMKVQTFNQRVKHQIMMADVVILNKTDLVKNAASELKTTIRTINPYAEIKEAVFCNIDFVPGEGPISKIYFEKTKSLSRPEINSLVIRSNKKISKQSLWLFLHKWTPLAIRIKGFIRLSDGEVMAIHCVFGNIESRTIENHFYPTEIIALTEKFEQTEWENSFRQLADGN